MIMVFFIFIIMFIIMIIIIIITIIEDDVTCEKQILNESMIVAVVIAIYRVRCALSRQDHQEVTHSYLSTNRAHTV